MDAMEYDALGDESTVEIAGGAEDASGDENVD